MSAPLTSSSPKRAGAVLAALILGAIVANINLSVANIALPDIGKEFDAPQTGINLVAIGCTLGLAMSVLYFGALGDRYGRKLMLLLGLGLTLPASAISAWAPSIDILIGGRIFTGIAAGMAYPTTLALITALWSEGSARTKAIALWSGISAGAMVIGPVIAGWLLEHFWWGSVFLIAAPIAVISFFLVLLVVPAHANESTKPVDNLGGAISVAMIALLVLGLGTIASPGEFTRAAIFILLSFILIAIFLWRQRRAANPLYELKYAKRTMFWAPTIAGMIIFGSLMGSMFIGQQYLQNVLSYSTLSAGLAILPAAIALIAVAPVSAKLVINAGSRNTMLLGYGFILPAFLVMLIAWKVDTTYLWVGLAYLLIGIGGGLVLTPASRALTASVPVSRVGMASGTTDLQRDLGGAIMQAILGSMLTAGYAAAFASAVSASAEAAKVSASTEATLQQSFASAAAIAQQYPKYSSQIIEAAKQSFLDGANWAYAAGTVAIILGAVLVALRIPGKAKEDDLLSTYAKTDANVTD